MNHNIKILIAEDEPIILKNIAKKVSMVSPYFQIIGKAESSKEALQLIEKEVPHILITDIEMPETNGLELIKQVKEKYPFVHILIISGYSNFEYAKTALQYGVEDYILKPVLQSDLEKTLLTLADIITKEQHSETRDILSKTLQGNLPQSQTPSNFPEGDFRLIYLTFGNLPTSAGILPSSEEIVLDFCAFFSSFPSMKHFWEIDESYPFQKFIILHTTDANIFLRKISKDLFCFLKKTLGSLPFHILVYTDAISYQQIGTTAQIMRTALPDYVSLFCQSLSFYPGDAPCPKINSQEKREEENLLRISQSSSSFIRLLLKTLSHYQDNGFSQNILVDFISQSFRAISIQYGIDEDVCSADLTSFLRKLTFMTSQDEFLEVLHASILLLLQGNSEESNNSDFLYLKIKLYIETNFNQKISLDDLSFQYGYTASYINRLFKKECGISPLQYQAKLRLEQSKILLNKNMEIKNIAIAIGYDDARYFSRVFKNETGLTPTEWLCQQRPHD